MNTKNEKLVLITGGLGFIGRHLSMACRNAGMRVRVLDVVNPELAALPQDMEYIQKDYKDLPANSSILDSVDYIVHLAHEPVNLSNCSDVKLEYSRNVSSNIAFINACLVNHIERFVFVSSGGTVYGKVDPEVPIREESQNRPLSLYGLSKLMSEQVGFYFFESREFPFLAARPGNAYGPGQIPFTGQGVIATALASALEGKPLTVYGSGNAIRDYIYITDLVDALVSLMLKGKTGEAYNVGNTCGTSLKTLLNEYICPLVEDEGFELIVNYTKSRTADVPYNVLDNNKLIQDTSFSPRTGLEEGVKKAWEWLKNNY